MLLSVKFTRGRPLAPFGRFQAPVSARAAITSTTRHHSHAGYWLAPALLIAATIAPPSLAQATPMEAQQTTKRSPRVTLDVSPTSIPSTWKLRITNRDDAPSRVVADIRYLRLLVRLPKDGAYHVCSLPKDMKPDSVSRWLTLEPGQSYEQDFNPLLFCWGPKRSAWLTPGTSVTAFFGNAPSVKRRWKHRKTLRPFVFVPAYDSAPFVPVHQLVSLTSWLPKSRSGRLAASLRSKGDTRSQQPFQETKLALTSQRWADARSSRSVWLTVRLKNQGPRAATVHLRPDNLIVLVRHPDGHMTQCGPGPLERAVVRDFFHVIKPGRSQKLQMRLHEYCGPDTFRRPGLYHLSPQIVLREDGGSYGLRAVTGSFKTPIPTLLRVRTGRAPWYAQPPAASAQQP